MSLSKRKMFNWRLPFLDMVNRDFWRCLWKATFGGKKEIYDSQTSGTYKGTLEEFDSEGYYLANTLLSHARRNTTAARIIFKANNKKYIELTNIVIKHLVFKNSWLPKWYRFDTAKRSNGRNPMENTGKTVPKTAKIWKLAVDKKWPKASLRPCHQANKGLIPCVGPFLFLHLKCRVCSDKPIEPWMSTSWKQWRMGQWL